ncbi:MAG: hypothetical protein WCK65_03940 [Rhodospirillaceae bacterium]
MVLISRHGLGRTVSVLLGVSGSGSSRPRRLKNACCVGEPTGIEDHGDGDRDQRLTGQARPIEESLVRRQVPLGSEFHLRKDRSATDIHDQTGGSGGAGPLDRSPLSVG